MGRRVPLDSQCDFIGAGEKSRTPDLRITNALLYQLSYAGVAADVAAAREGRILAEAASNQPEGGGMLATRCPGRAADERLDGHSHCHPRAAGEL
jgi:hypothetical protein